MHLSLCLPCVMFAKTKGKQEFIKTCDDKKVLV